MRLMGVRLPQHKNDFVLCNGNINVFRKWLPPPSIQCFPEEARITRLVFTYIHTSHIHICCCGLWNGNKKKDNGVNNGHQCPKCLPNCLTTRKMLVSISIISLVQRLIWTACERVLPVSPYNLHTGNPSVCSLLNKFPHTCQVTGRCMLVSTSPWVERGEAGIATADTDITARNGTGMQRRAKRTAESRRLMVGNQEQPIATHTA